MLNLLNSSRQLALQSTDNHRMLCIPIPQHQRGGVAHEALLGGFLLGHSVQDFIIRKPHSTNTKDPYLYGNLTRKPLTITQFADVYMLLNPALENTSALGP